MEGTALSANGMGNHFCRISLAAGLGAGMGEVNISTYCLRRNFVTVARKNVPKEILQVSNGEIYSFRTGNVAAEAQISSPR